MDRFFDERPKQRDMGMRFRTWNVKSLYMAHSLVTVWKELSEYKLHLLECRRSVGEYTFFYAELNQVQVFFNIRESYHQLKGWVC
jgi:hypothetical protein